MERTELRDLETARQFLTQGIWFARAVKPSPTVARAALEWALEIASAGEPLPPTGFLADLGHIALGHTISPREPEPLALPGWPAARSRTYEDHVLGKFYADWLFERASDALRGYAENEQARGLAYVVKQFRERATLGGVELSPAVIRGLLAGRLEQSLEQARDEMQKAGPLPLLLTQYEQLVAAARRMAEVLGPEDVIALEQRTALDDMGQYVAHRQILQVTDRLEAALPHRPVKPLVGRTEVPTRIHDEDQYPVGGYASLSNRGSIESLLHSQLAFMEPHERPDLFDLKFVRDELVYYARDENQFLRQRRTFVVIFAADLLAARFKDQQLPVQRIVLALALVLAFVRRLGDWLSTDAVRWEFLFLQQNHKSLLVEESALMERLLREPIARGEAALRWLTDADAARQHVEQLTRHSQVHALLLTSRAETFSADGAVAHTLLVNGPQPFLEFGQKEDEARLDDDPFVAWERALLLLLQLWI